MVVTDEIGRKRVFDDAMSQPWTSYFGVPWVGPDPEVEGYELLSIYRSRGGMAASHPPMRALFITKELSDYVCELHNLVRENGGLEAVKEKLRG